MAPPDLEASVRSNLWGDLVFQALLLLTYVLVVRSSWLLVLWGIRWLVVAGVWTALGLVRRGREDAALVALIGGHCLGIVGTAIVLPEFTPLTVLVAVGDLVLLVPFASPRRAIPLVAVLVASATAASGFSMQSWTGLADASPRWVIVSFIVGHVIGSATGLARSARSAEAAVLEQVQALETIRTRTTTAARDAARSIRRELGSGPASALRHLEGVVVTTDLALRRADAAAAKVSAEDGVEGAQRCLHELRSISHGVFPEVLHRSGLAAAVTALAASSDVRLDASVEPVAMHESCVMAVYGLVASAVRMAGDRPGVTVRVETRAVASGDEVAFAVSVSGAATDLALPEAVTDRIGAVGGTVAAIVERGTWSARGRIPVSIGPASDAVPTTLGPADHQETAALELFLRYGLAFTVAGLGLVVTAYLVTGLPLLAVAAPVLLVVIAIHLVAQHVFRQGRRQAAAIVMCVQESFAAVSVTALFPWIAPTTAAIATLPIVVSPPRLSGRTLRTITLVQTAVAGTCALLGLADGPVFGLDPPSDVLAGVVLPLATGGLVALIGLTAIENHGRLRTLLAATRQSLGRLVVAVDTERRRIERDLHDGAQQHVVAVALQLRAVVKLVSDGAADRARTVLAEVGEQIDLAGRELDELSRGVFPAGLVEGDVTSALRDVVQRAPVPVTLEVAADVAPVPADVAAAVYFSCAEAIQNAAKHGGDGVRVTVRLAREDGLLTVAVSDDGVGVDLARVSAGRGFSNLRERMELAGGTWTVASTPGRGVTVRLAVPLVGPGDPRAADGRAGEGG